MATLSQRGTPRPDNSPTKEELNRPGVYLLFCPRHNVGYVGSAKLLCARYTIHFTHFKRGTNAVKELQRIYDQEGVDALEFRVLEALEGVTEAFDKRLLTLEGEWIIRLGKSINLVNAKNEGGSKPITLGPRLSPGRTRGRGYLLAHPEIIKEQIAAWQALLDAAGV